MPSITIIKMPTGEAPEEVLKQWVGLEFPIEESRSGDGIDRAILGQPRKPEYATVYLVSTVLALNMLGLRSQSAAQWYRDHIDVSETPSLSFDGDICQLAD